MRQSELFTKTLRQVPRDEESINARLLIKAGFINKEIAGVYTLLPLGFRVIKNIEKIIREEMLNIKAQEVLMPALQPKVIWEKTGRWKTFDTLFRLKSINSQQEYALGPTHEEIVVPLLKKFLSSFRDLPQAVFQIQTKFRDEPRAKAGLLRGREFIMKDLYSFHSSEKDLMDYYDKLRGVYLKTFKRMGLEAIETLAGGGTFSDFSYEYQVISPSGEDTIIYCERKGCGFAENKEITREKTGKLCKKCLKVRHRSLLKEAKTIEVGNVFPLKEKFAKVFDLRFQDKDGKSKFVLMGCYGIGLTRVMGAIVEVSHDKDGIIWPESVAPFQYHLVALPGGEELAERIYRDFSSKGIEIFYDDRKYASPGEKLVDADLIGIPLRIVVSSKTVAKKSAEVKKRKEKKINLLKISQLPNLFNIRC